MSIFLSCKKSLPAPGPGLPGVSPELENAVYFWNPFQGALVDPQKALGYAGHVAGHQNWAAKVGLDFGRPENQSKHKRAVNQ